MQTSTRSFIPTQIASDLGTRRQAPSAPGAGELQQRPTEGRSYGMRKRCRWQRGYSVVEVMVSVGLVGMIFASVLTGFSLAFSVLQTARENLRATQILQEKMETIRLYSWDQINTPGFVPSTFTASSNPTNQTSGVVYTGTIVITNAPLTEVYNTNLLEVIAHVAWTSGNVQRNRKMTTFVSRYGLQNYVY